MNHTNLFGHDDIQQHIIGRFAQGAATKTASPAKREWLKRLGYTPAAIAERLATETKELSPGAARILELTVKALDNPSRPLSPLTKAILKRVKAIR